MTPSKMDATEERVVAHFAGTRCGPISTSNHLDNTPVPRSARPESCALRILPCRADGSALVITLLFLVIVTVLVVGLFSVMQPERISSSSSVANTRANAFCQMGADHAVALIRGATGGTAPTSPAQGIDTAGNSTGQFWASQPGRITVFKSDGTVDTANSVNLFSESNVTPPDTSAVDLNQPSFGGKYPIASPNSVPNPVAGTNMDPAMNVQWINVLQDPTKSSSSTNQIIGRYAFWVDDELAKINVNTADGTGRSGTSNVDPGQFTFGFGTPTEVDLQALRTGGTTPLPFANAQAIAAQSGARPSPTPAGKVRPFNDASEILQVPGVPPTLYSDNNFNLTAYNRAPELNIFGEPKIYIMPTMLGPRLATPSSPQYLANLTLGPYSFSGSNSSVLWLYGQSEFSPPGTYNGTGGYDYIYTGRTLAEVAAQPVNQIYPLSGKATILGKQLPLIGNQLPLYNYNALSGAVTVSGSSKLPQCFTFGGSASPSGNPLTASDEYLLGMRIAKYLKGLNSQGKPITWPAYPGANDPGTAGFAGKYTDRQIDSITLQLLDIIDRGYLADHARLESIPTIMGHGFLSNQLVCGTGNLPRFTEVKVTFTTAQGSYTANGTTVYYPLLKIEIAVEAYLPKEYRSTNIHDGKNNRDLTWYWGVGGNVGGWLNLQDTPVWQNNVTFTDSQGATFTGVQKTVVAPATASQVGGSALGGFWQDNLLRITDANDGTCAGFDLFGNDPGFPDPDPRAAAFHPYAVETNPSSPYFGKVMGTGPRPPSATDKDPAGNLQWNPKTNYQAFAMTGIQAISPSNSWTQGDYHSALNTAGRAGVYYRGKPGVTSINISGGLTLWTHTASGAIPFDFVPLDSIHGPANNSAFTPTQGPQGNGYSTQNPWAGLKLNDANGTPDPTANPITDPAFRQRILDAVIPIEVKNLPVPGGSVTVVLQVADPMVNKFPGDWVNTGANSTLKTVPQSKTNPLPTGTVYQDQDGANKGFKGVDDGDPQGFWFPEQNTGIPKSQRFPSTGYLQYIRTGMMPDKTLDSAPLSQQKGTPFRMFNFAPSTHRSQQTSGGTSYPDWAMLDLFTVPATFQAPFQSTDPTPPSVLLTWGGATTGRLNPNSALVSGANSPFAFSRTVPLQGLLRNLRTSTTYDSSNNQVLDPPIKEQDLAELIDDYVANLKDTNNNRRPMMLPGEICNVPEVAKYLYDKGASPSRNDLVRQIVGNLSTRSNTFTVWTVGQVVKKKPNTQNYDRCQAGDTIVGESRMKFLVERYIDPGVDGLPGNPYAPGSDAINGTVDDPVDANYNPALTYPLRYKYRVLSATQIDTR